MYCIVHHQQHKYEIILTLYTIHICKMNLLLIVCFEMWNLANNQLGNLLSNIPVTTLHHLKCNLICLLSQNWANQYIYCFYLIQHLPVLISQQVSCDKDYHNAIYCWTNQVNRSSNTQSHLQYIYTKTQFS